MEYRPILERRAIVVGAGVVGMTSAISLLRDGWKVYV
jgi:2-polyprenyl-6-methoxyphenol hydroxylase-like FAD-dependent oxidoreductase